MRPSQRFFEPVASREDDGFAARPGGRTIAGMRPVAAALLAAVLLFAAGCAPPAAPGEAALPGPALAGAPGRAASGPEVEAACEGCHHEIAAEWRRSQHRQSFTSPAFQASLAEDNLPFCRGCHAPEAPPEAPPPPRLAAIGVGCTTCHLAGAAILAAPAASARAAPHAVVRDPRFATEAACAGCHQFKFPGESLAGVPDQMQLTISEHAESAYSGVACAGCHMPVSGEGDGRHRSHAFLGSRAPAAQALALRIRAERGATSVHVSVAPGEVGHAFPTGDLFRRLEVRAEAVTPEGGLLARETRYLARHFEQRRAPSGAPVRALLWDDRPGAPGPAAAGVELDMELGPPAAAHAVSLRVAFQRVKKLIDGAPESAAPVESEAVLFDALLPPPGATLPTR